MGAKKKKEVKKTAKISKSAKKLPPENTGPNGEMKIDDMSLQKLCRLEAEVRAGRNQFTLEQLQMANYVASIDKDGVINKMQASLQSLVQQVQTAEAAYNGLRDEIGRKLGINLREYSFDDQSGLLHKHGEKPRAV